MIPSLTVKTIVGHCNRLQNDKLCPGLYFNRDGPIKAGSVDHTYPSTTLPCALPDNKGTSNFFKPRRHSINAAAMGNVPTTLPWLLRNAAALWEGKMRG
jgi:hypothetical protein